MKALHLAFSLLIAISTVTIVQAEEWIMGTALTDEHEVIENTCADNFFGNTWKTNKFGSINGFGTLSDDGTQCTTKNRKARTVTRSGYTAYWILVEDRILAASYSPELNYPLLEAGIVIAEDSLAVNSDNNEYTWDPKWIMGTALTDDHVVIDNTCADNFFGNTWKTNNFGDVNGFGTLSDDGTECYTLNRSASAVTRSGVTSYWTFVADRLEAASYSPELNWPIIEGGVINADTGDEDWPED